MASFVATTTLSALRTAHAAVPNGRRVAASDVGVLGRKLRRQTKRAPVGGDSGRHQRAVLAGAAAEELKSAEVEDKALELPTSDESDELLRLRHSAAHMMAMAVQRLFPGAMCTIGPWIERGFYYDFDMAGNPLTESDLKKIQKEMERISRKNLPFVREEVSAAEARTRIEAIAEPYKLEILESILAKDPNAPITIYHIGQPGEEGSWWDLCAGPHVEHTGKIRPKGLKLESLAGAYWRGDETRPMLQRVYGTAWQSKEQLKAYELMKEEAAKRDHRKLGKELKLFSIQDCAGGGLVFWHPKGAAVRNVVENYWKEVHLARGYELIYSPHVAKLDLWKTSGHFDFYAENMYDQMQVEEEVYQLKPMNCPFHIAVYQDGFYSYRDLPLRWAELGTVYRYERSGTMHGLFRVRGFTQDDGHIFCTPDQIADEIRGVLDLTQELLGTFGFSDYEVNLSTRPEKSVGDDAIWDAAEAALAEALGGKGWDYVVDEGGGAFYGPKIDIKIKDAIGRKWQCATVQLDFNLPERFGMEYIDEANTRQRPIMIHRAILGSIERFFGVLIENYAGAFPLWMAPVQARILPVTDDMLPACCELKAELQAAGVRVDIASGERLAKLVRTAELSKIPVMAVVGKRDAEAGAVSVRTYADGDLGSMPLPEFKARLVKRIADREPLF